jgi:transglutaminase-like putative cysteine protease
MRYTVQHVTEYRYTAPVAESVTEIRMQPATTAFQRCLVFRLQVRPAAKVFAFQDHQGNHVHHFSQPAPHDELAIVAEAEVEVIPHPPLPPALAPGDWGRIDARAAAGEHWELLAPSEMTPPGPRLDVLAGELDVQRRGDPLTVLCALNTALYLALAYDAGSTRVDSPIDEALTHRRGVCQDFAHIMLALMRTRLRIPCRYVSGYLHPRRDDHSTPGASHAWVEAWLPGLEWVGFDPTNNILAGERHIQVAFGRDYQDVPPTRGVFKGAAGSDLTVAVHVRPFGETSNGRGPARIVEQPAYRATVEELQSRYAQAVLAIQMQQQQQ